MKKAPLNIEIKNARRGAVSARAVFNADANRVLVTVYEASRKEQTVIESLRSETLPVVVRRHQVESRPPTDNSAYLKRLEEEKNRVLDLAIRCDMTPAELAFKMGALI